MKQLAFTEQELYEMWKNFREDDNAIIILSDFMVSTKSEAAALINLFEIKYESEALNSGNRGKADRVRKHI